MDLKETGLGLREVYLLGTLARLRGVPVSPTKNTPRGCGPAQFQTLVGLGYASAVVRTLADGSQEVVYEVTQLGLKAWNSFQFFI